MNDYVTKQEFNDRCDIVDGKLDKMREDFNEKMAEVSDNHLNTMLNFIIGIDEKLDRKLGRFWTKFGIALTALAIILSVVVVVFG